MDSKPTDKPQVKGQVTPKVVKAGYQPAPKDKPITEGYQPTPKPSNEVIPPPPPKDAKK